MRFSAGDVLRRSSTEALTTPARQSTSAPAAVVAANRTLRRCQGRTGALSALRKVGLSQQNRAADRTGSRDQRTVRENAGQDHQADADEGAQNGQRIDRPQRFHQGGTSSARHGHRQRQSYRQTRSRPPRAPQGLADEANIEHAVGQPLHSDANQGGSITNVHAAAQWSMASGERTMLDSRDGVLSTKPEASYQATRCTRS